MRGISSSVAKAADVTTAEILPAADWSSASTFQKFYIYCLQNAEDKMSFREAVLSYSDCVKLTCSF